MSKAKLNHGVRIVSAALYAVAAGCLRVSLPQANLMPAAPAHELAWQEAVALALSLLAGWSVLISPQSVLLAVGFSVIVGLVFGLWPAIKASALHPIDALRYE